MKKRAWGVVLSVLLLLTSTPSQLIAAEITENYKSEIVTPDETKTESTPNQTNQTKISDEITPDEVTATGLDSESYYFSYGVTIADIERQIGGQIATSGNDQDVLPLGLHSYFCRIDGAYRSIEVYIRVPLDECTITLEQQSYTYTGFDNCPPVSIAYYIDGKNILQDYYLQTTLTYENNITPGTASVKISTENSEYLTGSVTKTFTIKGLEISECTVEKLPAVIYSGKAKKPAVTVVDKNRNQLAKGRDYTVSYQNNKSIGTATVIIKGKGNYTGTKKVTFKINPKKVSKLKIATVTTSGIRLQWSKDKNVTGYEIYRYSDASEKHVKIKTITKKNVVSFLSSGLSSGKKYFYRVRSYKTIDGKKYYSGYKNISATTSFAATAYEQQYDEGVANAVKALKLKGKSDYQKVKSIHDYICRINTYDYTYAHFAGYDVLASGTSVCMGYTELFYDMAVRAGLEVDIVTGMNHAWNMVKVDGKWYAIDLTWDDGNDSNLIYSYFLLSESEMKKTHDYEQYYAVQGIAGLSGWVNVLDLHNYAERRASYQLAAINYADQLALDSVKLSSAASKSAKQVTLKWEKETTASKYIVYRSMNKNGKYRKLATLSASRCSYADKKVKRGKKYYYKIRAYKTVGSGKVYGDVSAIKAVTVR